MQNISILRWGCQNFKLYTDPIEMDMNDKNLVLLTGGNGHGKTSLLEVIPFTWYGTTTTGLSTNDVVNNRVGKNCKTWVEFEVSDENQTSKFQCIRYGNYSKVGNDVILRKDGYEFKRGHRDVSNEILKMVGSKKLFMNTRFFGQKVKDFFMDLKDSDQKEIFRSILPLDEYDEYRQAANDNIKQLKEQISEKNNRIDFLNNSIQENENRVKELQDEREEFYRNKELELQRLENQKTEIQNEIKEIEDKINSFDGNIDDLNKKYEKLLNEKSKIENSINNIDNELQNELNNIENKSNNKISELENSYYQEKDNIDKNRSNNIENIESEYNKIINELQNKVDEITKNKNDQNNELIKVQSDLDNYDNTINLFYSGSTEEILNGKVEYCPTCKNKITEDCIQHIQNDIQKIQEEKDNLSKRKEELESQINDLNNQINETNQEVYDKQNEKSNEIQKIEDTHQNNILELNQRLNDSKQKVKEIKDEQKNKIREEFDEKKKNLNIQLQNSNSELNQVRDYIKQLNELYDQMNSKKNEIQLIENSIENQKQTEFNDSNIDYHNRKIEECNKEIDEINKELNELNLDLEAYEFWWSAFSNSGIPSMLIDDAIPYMNERVKHYLDQVSNGRFVVSFDTLKENKSGDFRDKISVNVYDTETLANTRNQFSGGQTRIIDIATILTLADLQTYMQGLDFNLIMFDEVFDALDDTNIEYVCSALRRLSQEKRICVISHRYIEHLEADEILTF